MGTTYELRLIEDNLAAGVRLAFPADRINRAIYVVHGSVEAHGQPLDADHGVHVQGAASLVAGTTGAALWRWELAPAGSAAVSVATDVGATHVKLARAIAWPVADAALMRLDSVSFPPGGCAFLHTHQGPGIRCLIEGGIRIDTHGQSTSYGPGSAWFEAGPEPVFAQAAPERASRFIRVMILPAALKGRSSIAYVNTEDRDKPKSQQYKGYVDTAITL